MGHNPDRELPFFFQKPADSAVVCNPSSVSTVPYPVATSSLHYEAELIVAISKDGGQISTDNAMDHVFGYSLGCDLTRRDLQAEAKKMGRPWDAAKGFDSSCPLTPIVPKEHIKLADDTQIQLAVNGTIRQSSSLGKMIYSVPEIIHHLSELFYLRAGDLIMTGTPAGVSELQVGDQVSITCGELLPCQFVVGPPS
jgi:fumarylpyruvate hydrolase